jgi:hypothetical protein
LPQAEDRVRNRKLFARTLPLYKSSDGRLACCETQEKLTCVLSTPPWEMDNYVMFQQNQTISMPKRMP